MKNDAKIWLANRARQTALALIGEGNDYTAAERYSYMASGHVDSHTKWSSSRYEAAGILLAFREHYGSSARQKIADLLDRHFHEFIGSYGPMMEATRQMAELTGN